MIKLVSLLAVSLLWLGLVASPVLLSSVVGVVLWQAGLSAPLAMSVCISLGALVGVLWAESVRKSVGLIAFWGHLIGHRDIDGPSPR